MLWPLTLLPTAMVACATTAAALLSLASAHRMRALSHSAALSGNRAAIDATARRVRRAWHRHLTYALPVVGVGMALLITQAASFLVVAFRLG